MLLFLKEIIKHYMNQEEINILKVDDGLYGNRLRQNLFLSRNLFDYESNLIKAVAKLIRWDFILEDHKTFFKEEEKDQEVLLLSPPPEIIVNKELLARWLDFGMCFIEINNPQQLKVVTNAYLDVYSATGEKKYFLRALQFGRAVKGMFKARIEEFNRIGTGYIQRDIHPFWQDKILAVLISFCGLKRCKEDFTTFFMDQEANLAEKGDFSGARKTLDCQKTLQILKTDEVKIKCAELYMAEGDSWLEKNAATHYVGVADIYLKGFRKLHSVGNCEDLRKELLNRIEVQQVANNKILGSFGVNLLPEIDFEKLRLGWALLGVSDFNTAFYALLDFKMISAKEVNKLIEEEKAQGYYFNEMMDSVSLSSRGTQVGFLSGGDAIGQRIRMRLREFLLANIQALKLVMDVDGYKDADFIAGLMPQSSPFIEDERCRIFFKGLYAGFEHDFETAAYILTPQFEYAFKYLAINNDIQIVRYQDKQQFDNTMGGCLEKIRPLLSEDTFLELQSFLTDTNQLNFRNNLLHGISRPGMVKHFGKYVWWLALKMVFRPQELLKKLK